MIEFVSLSVKDFFSVREVSLPLNKNGAILVTGEVRGTASAFTSNGAGKTTIFNALVWGLFGRTIRNLPSDEDVIRLGADETKVEVKLLVDGVQYTVQRSRKRNKASKLRVLTKTGDDALVGASVVAMSRMLEDRLLHCTFDAFCNTVYFPQGAFTFFTQANDVERKKIFDRLLGTVEFVDWEKRAKQLREHLQNEADELSSKKLSAAAALEIHNETMVGLREEKKAADAAYAKGLSLLDEDTSATLVRLEKDVAEREAELTKAEKELEARAKLDEGMQECQRAYDKALTGLQTAKKALDAIDNRVSKYEALVANESCPTCTQKIDKDVLSESVGKELLAEQEGCLADLTGWENVVAQHKADLAKWREAIEDSKARASSVLTLLIRNLKTRISEDSVALLSLQSAKVERDKQVAKLDAALKEATQSIAKREKHTSERIAATIAEGDSIEKALVKNDAKMQQAEFWINGFGPRGIRSLIFENVLPYINERANHYSSILTDGTIAITVSATSRLKSGEDREKIYVSAINADGAQVYEGNSGGERKRVDLCILLALQDLVMNRSQGAIKLSVYDELLDELDEEGIERVVELLKERGQTQPVYLISHNATLKGFFEDTINVVKTDGISSIEA